MATPLLPQSARLQSHENALLNPYGRTKLFQEEMLRWALQDAGKCS